MILLWQLLVRFTHMNHLYIYIYIAVCSCIFFKHVAFINLSSPTNYSHWAGLWAGQGLRQLGVWRWDWRVCLHVLAIPWLNEWATDPWAVAVSWPMCWKFGWFPSPNTCAAMPHLFLRQDSSNDRMAGLLRSNTPGLGLGVADAKAKAMPGTPGGPGEKQPKKVNHQRLVSSKIAAMSSKMTDCMAWTSKLEESTTLFLSWFLPSHSHIFPSSHMDMALQLCLSCTEHPRKNRPGS